LIIVAAIDQRRSAAAEGQASALRFARLAATTAEHASPPFQDFAWLDRFAAASDLPPGSALLAIARAGVILRRWPAPGRDAPPPAADLAIIRAVLGHDGAGVTTAAGADGVTRFYGFVPLRGTSAAAEAFVVVGIKCDRALADADRAIERGIAALVLAA